MKKVNLLFLFCSMFIFSYNAVAQSGGGCVPDTQFIGFGIFPPPDTSELKEPPEALFSDPTLGISTIGESGQFFSFDMTAVIPDSLDAEPFIGVPLVVPLQSVQVQSAEGIDSDNVQAMGFTQMGWTLENNVACSQPDCFFEPNVPGGLTYECARLSGTLPTVAVQTDYEIIFQIEGIAILFGNPVPVTLNYPDGMGSFPGRYALRVDPATGVEDIIAQQLSVAQNVPNPFSSVTEISLNSTKADTYEFSVYNLVGGLVYSEKINAFEGENSIFFDASNLSGGVYMYSIGNEDGVITKRMMIEK